MESMDTTLGGIVATGIPESTLTYEQTACLLCGEGNSPVVYDGLSDWLCGGPGRFAIVECRGCGLRYLNPRPCEASIGQYYPVDYPGHSLSTMAAKSLRG